MGVSAGYSDLDVDYRFLVAGFDKRSLHLDAFASASTPIIDLAASIAYGFDSYDNISRATGVAGQISLAETEGDSIAVVAQASKDISFLPGLSLTPAVRIGYSKAEFDAFDETGATGLSQSVSKGSLTKTFAEFGATGRIDFLGADASIGGFYHVRLDGGSQQVTTALISLPGFVRTANVSAADRDYGRIEASLSKTVGKVVIGASGTATIAADDFNDLAGTVYLGFAF